MSMFYLKIKQKKTKKQKNTENKTKAFVLDNFFNHFCKFLFKQIFFFFLFNGLFINFLKFSFY